MYFEDAVTYFDKTVTFSDREKQIDINSEIYLAIIVLKWGLNSLFILLYIYIFEIKTLFFVFNCFVEDLFQLISNKFRMVCKVERNLQLDSRDWSLYSRILNIKEAVV